MINKRPRKFDNKYEVEWIKLSAKYSRRFKESLLSDTISYKHIGDY